MPAFKDISSLVFEKGLDHYDPEGRVFPRIAIRISMGQELTKQDILQILKWKLGRVTDSNAVTVSNSNLAAINEAVKCAGNAGFGVDALEMLDRIPGIGLPTATAILAACYPDEFTIIDWRVLETLDLFPCRRAKEKRQNHNTDHWSATEYLFEYLPRVKEQRNLWGCTLRDADRALWGLSVSARFAEVISRSEEPKPS